MSGAKCQAGDIIVRANVRRGYVVCRVIKGNGDGLGWQFIDSALEFAVAIALARSLAREIGGVQAWVLGPDGTYQLIALTAPES